MKKTMSRCLAAGLAVAFGFMMGCGKQETSSVDAMEKKVRAAKPADMDAAAKPPANPETAIPKDHPAH